MKKIELLAPAGNMEALRAAIQNGADAIYLGGSMFGARASATNFDFDQMQAALNLAHGYGVKIYVTMNTLIKDNEFEECMKTVDRYYKMNVDALIVQDLGLMAQVRERYPNFELHASTQMHIHNVDGLRMLKKWGISRGVVARETSLELIKEMAKEDIDLEVFVYGAYCVSYSGQCLMSSSIGHRSGNRGECAQTCRLPYDLIQENDGKKTTITTKGQYLLSPKDLNTLAIVPKLIESGITSFKIEGRMKRPEYVALITSLYRKAIDAYLNHEAFVVDDAMKMEMQKIFHRGFTLGHLEHQMGSRLMSSLRPNHVGIEIGKVIQTTKDKITVKLHHELNQGDGIRVLDESEDVGFVVNYIYKNKLLVNQGLPHDVIELENSGHIKVGAMVLKTSDCKQLASLAKSIESNTRKVKLHGVVSIKRNEQVHLSIWDDESFHSEIQSEDFPELAIKTPLDFDRIMKQMTKTGSTPFQFESLEINIDEGLTYPISKLNELRRLVLEKHWEIRSTRQRELQYGERSQPIQIAASCIELHVSVSTQAQYEVAKSMGISNIDIIKRSLYDKIHDMDASVGFVHERVKKHPYDIQTGVIQEVGGLSLPHSMASPYLNVMNAYTAEFLFKQGCLSVAFSLECVDGQIQEICNNFKRITNTQGNFEMMVYGRNENMITEACVINTNLLDNDKKNCRLCKGSTRYYLKDRKNQCYPLYGDDDCCLHIYHSEIRNDLARLEQYQAMGISHYRCIFVDEQDETEKVLRKAIAAIRAIGGKV